VSWELGTAVIVHPWPERSFHRLSQKGPVLSAEPRYVVRSSESDEVGSDNQAGLLGWNCVQSAGRRNAIVTGWLASSHQSA
jgi:hypothetical protein